MIELYIDSCIVRGFVLSWHGAPSQYCEHSIWDCAGFALGVMALLLLSNWCPCPCHDDLIVIVDMQVSLLLSL
jgi:hypothetical protein